MTTHEQRMGARTGRASTRRVGSHPLPHAVGSARRDERVADDARSGDPKAPSRGGAGRSSGAVPRFPSAGDLLDMAALYRWVYDGTLDAPLFYDQEVEDRRGTISAAAVLFAVGVGLLVAGAVIGVVFYRLGELGSVGWW